MYNSENTFHWYQPVHFPRSVMSVLLRTTLPFQENKTKYRINCIGRMYLSINYLVPTYKAKTNSGLCVQAKNVWFWWFLQLPQASLLPVAVIKCIYSANQERKINSAQLLFLFLLIFSHKKCIKYFGWESVKFVRCNGVLNEYVSVENDFNGFSVHFFWRVAAVIPQMHTEAGGINAWCLVDKWLLLSFLKCTLRSSQIVQRLSISYVVFNASIHVFSK